MSWTRAALQVRTEDRWRIFVGGVGAGVFVFSAGIAGGFIALLGFGMLLFAVLRGRSSRPSLIVISVACALVFISQFQPWLSIDPASRLCREYCTSAYGGFERGLDFVPNWLAAAASLLLLLTVLRVLRSGPGKYGVPIMVLLSAALSALMIWQLVDFEQDYAWWLVHAAKASPSMAGAALFGPVGALVTLAAAGALLYRRLRARRRSVCRA